MGNNNMQVFIVLSLLVAVTISAPQYHSAPAPGYAAPDLAEVSPYSYNYAVADDYSGAAFSQTENNDGTGVVSGSYSVNLPDGRIQHVNYHANDIDGFVSEVSYDGAASYPETIAHPLAHAPLVAHAPLLAHAPLVAHPVAHHPLIGHPVAHAPLFGHPVAHAPLIGHPVARAPVLGHPIAHAVAHPAFGHPVAHGAVLGHPVAHPAFKHGLSH